MAAILSQSQCVKSTWAISTVPLLFRWYVTLHGFCLIQSRCSYDVCFRGCIDDMRESIDDMLESIDDMPELLTQVAEAKL